VMAPTIGQVDEMIRFLPAAFTFPAIIARFTGLRIGQALRLEWRDCDLPAARLEVRPELGKTESERRGRVISISPHLVEMMMQDTWPKTSHLVAGEFKRFTRKSARRAWEVSGADPRLWDRRPYHALRKAFRTFLEAEGVSRRIVDHFVGHSDGNSGDRYVDPSFLDQEGAVALIPPLHSPTLTTTRTRSMLYMTSSVVNGETIKQSVMANDPAQAARFAADLIDPNCSQALILDVNVQGRDLKSNFRVECVQGLRHVATAIGTPKASNGE